MKVASSRQQHFLPAFYLAGFTASGKIDGRLHVYDYLRNRHYWSSPRKVAKERDYYRRHQSRDPNELEDAFSRLESAFAAALRRIFDEDRIASKAQVPDLLSFLALLLARGPRMREHIGRQAVAKARRDLVSGKMSADRWEAIRHAEIAAGAPERLFPTYDEARRMLKTGRWEPPVARTASTELLPVIYEHIRDGLIARPWQLMRCNPDADGGFICSDTPLSSLRMDSGYIMAPVSDRDAILTCPLSRRLALVSLFGKTGGNYTAPELVVADINTRTQLASMGMLYSTKEEFLLRRGDRAESSLDYFDYVRHARQRGLLRP